MTEQPNLTAVLFTDIEGSTKLWQKYTDAMKKNIVRHDAIVDGLIEQHGGKVIDHAGDGVFAVFEGGNPLQCALEIQQRMQDEPWDEIGELRIRMGLHAGIATKHGEDYRGPLINKTARIMSTGWGGQILVTPEITNAFPMPQEAMLQDLGLHQLKDLAEPQQINGLLHPTLKLSEFPALRSLSAHPHNLPLQNTPFIGREKELENIATSLADPQCRLLTLLGPGGIGKTRLALQAAADAIETFFHGIYFIHLAPVNAVDLVSSTIADALKFTFYSREAPKEQLLNYLREKELLLVMDNLEHLVETADLLFEILQVAPKVKLLVTSRERLNLAEESILEIGGMDIPSVELANREQLEAYPAIQLFLDRARKVDAGFALDEASIPHLIRTCELVGGMPLGIELAAAWVRMLSCEEIASEIEQKLDFLSSTLRNLPERHRSLRAVFEYSWNLLSEEEKDVFMKISVFRGSWGKEASQQVAGASILSLTSLLDKSLLRKTSGNRFFVQELLRYYGVEKLEEDTSTYQTVKNAHCKFFSDFLQQREQTLKGEEQKRALEEIRADIGNIRLAWRWSIEEGHIQQIETALEGLCLFFEKQGRFQEGKESCEAAISELKQQVKPEAEETHQRLLGKLLARQGQFCFRLGMLKEAEASLRQSMEIADAFDDSAEKGYALNYLGTLALNGGNFKEATRLLEQSLEIRQTLGDEWGVVAALSNLGTVAYLQGAYDEAKQRYQDGLAISRGKGDPWSIAALLNNLGEIARLQGDYEGSRQCFEESLSHREELGDRWGIAASQNNLGAVAHTLGNLTEAKQLYEESLAIRKELGDRTGIATSLINLGSIAYQQNELEEASRLFNECLSLRRTLGDLRGIASSLCELGNVALALGNLDEAKNHFQEALQTSMQIEVIPVALQSLVGIASFFEASDEPKRAVELYSLVVHHSTKDAKAQEKAETALASLKSQLPQETFTDAFENGKTADLAQLVSTIFSDA